MIGCAMHLIRGMSLQGNLSMSDSIVYDTCESKHSLIAVVHCLILLIVLSSHNDM